MIWVPRQNGAGAVELFEGDDEGEFVLEGQGAKGPTEVGLMEEALVVAIGPADEEATSRASCCHWAIFAENSRLLSVWPR